jgi:hypothetical protein
MKGGAVGDSSTLKTEWTEDQLVRLWPEMRARLLAYAYRLERTICSPDRLELRVPLEPIRLVGDA